MTTTHVTTPDRHLASGGKEAVCGPSTGLLLGSVLGGFGGAWIVDEGAESGVSGFGSDDW